MNYQTDIEIMGSEYAVICDYDYFPGCGETRNEYGVPTSPGEDLQIEVKSVKMDFSEGNDLVDMRTVNLPDKVVRQLEEEIRDNVYE